MRYKKAQDIFPDNIMKMLQCYADGEYIYFPRKNESRKMWGESTGSKEETKQRNTNIYQEYISGKTVKNLAADYFLSDKSIQRIIAQEKRELK